MGGIAWHIFVIVKKNTHICMLASNFYLAHLCSNISEFVHAYNRIPYDITKLVSIGRVACGLDGATDNLRTAGSNLINLRTI